MADEGSSATAAGNGDVEAVDEGGDGCGEDDDMRRSLDVALLVLKTLSISSE